MIGRLVAIVLGVAILSGCGAQEVFLGTEGSMLLTTRDVLALPGEEVHLRARLQGGDLLRDRPGYVVLFSRRGRLFKAAETGEDGVASVSFTPQKAGDYPFRVEVASAGLPQTPPPQELLVACRTSETPIAVVDLDKTLVASGFQAVLLGSPAPMPGSVEVMRRLAEGHAIVYLTHRPEYFGTTSRAWLDTHGYPEGPLLLSSVSEFIKGSGAYKTGAIRRLGGRFPNMRIGIGDKVSDALAYHENGLTSFLIVQIPRSDSPQPYEELATELEALPPSIHVVTAWPEIERVVFEGASYPPSRIVAMLRERAETVAAASTYPGSAPASQPVNRERQ